MSIFLDPEFILFHDTLTTYPVAVYYFFLLIIICYFLLTVFGLLSADSLDIDVDVSSDGIDTADLSLLSGLLYRFGLFGIPFIFIIATIVLLGLAICFYPSFYLNKLFPSGIMHYALGSVIFIVTLLLSMIVTGQILKPIRNKLPKPVAKNAKSLLGKKAIVRTSRLDHEFGEMVLEDGGAGLILKGRATDIVFHNGDAVVMVSYDTEENAYFVISEEAFNQG